MSDEDNNIRFISRTLRTHPPATVAFDYNIHCEDKKICYLFFLSLTPPSPLTRVPLTLIAERKSILRSNLDEYDDKKKKIHVDYFHGRFPAPLGQIKRQRPIISLGRRVSFNLWSRAGKSINFHRHYPPHSLTRRESSQNDTKYLRKLIAYIYIGECFIYLFFFRPKRIFNQIQKKKTRIYIYINNIAVTWNALDDRMKCIILYIYIQTTVEMLHATNFYVYIFFSRSYIIFICDNLFILTRLIYSSRLRREIYTVVL